MKKSAMVELYGVASRSMEKAQRVSDTFGIPHCFPSYEALLSDKTIEAVYIPLPNHIHLEWIKKAAYAEKHILCEKPLALNTRDAHEAIDYTKKKGVLLMEAFMYRFHPQWKRAAELARTGNIGTVRAVHTFFSYHNTDPQNIRNIFEMGGGALYDIGCYAVSTARYMFEREPIRVMSLMNRDSSFKTDVLTSGVMDFGEGHAVFTVGTQLFPYQRVDIHGSSGRIQIRIPFNTFEDVPAKITVTTGVGSREIQFEPADQYGLQFEEFSETVRKGGPVPVPPEDALNNIAVIDALFRSENSGNWENVRLS